jgi:hypothetical protein
VQGCRCAGVHPVVLPPPVPKFQPSVSLWPIAYELIGICCFAAVAVVEVNFTFADRCLPLSPTESKLGRARQTAIDPQFD